MNKNPKDNILQEQKWMIVPLYDDYFEQVLIPVTEPIKQGNPCSGKCVKDGFREIY